MASTLAVAACGPSHGAAKSEASSLQANPTTSKAITTAKAAALSCINAGGHTAIIRCLEGLVPPPERLKVKRCLISTFSTDILSHAGRMNLKSGNPEAVCLQKAGL
jgi:hypothetical protein